ncbi:MAG: thioredoxin family protein [Verrucomicrobiota bacterium]|nr:thioredoxin family protein [Verrucomicrobiota bacterium]MEC8650211.1 thioredoxin family protein [Verrucomicrobiota bacterium]
MKKSIISLTLLAASALFFVATRTSADLTDTATSAEQGDSMHGAWELNFEQAQARAKAENKPMLLDFTGSDWCGWCIRLDKEVFSQPEFKAYAAESLVLVELDFPRGKKQSAEIKAQNKALAKKYSIRGYPTIVLLTAEGELIERTGYQRGGAANYVAHIKEILAGG